MMKTRTYTGLAGRVLFGLILGFLLILILALFPGSVRARPLSLPPRATPTPVPTATPVPVAAESDPRLYGAQITLRLAPDMPGGRAVVCWLDALGRARCGRLAGRDRRRRLVVLVGGAAGSGKRPLPVGCI